MNWDEVVWIEPNLPEGWSPSGSIPSVHCGDIENPDNPLLKSELGGLFSADKQGLAVEVVMHTAGPYKFFEGKISRSNYSDRSLQECKAQSGDIMAEWVERVCKFYDE